MVAAAPRLCVRLTPLYYFYRVIPAPAPLCLRGGKPDQSTSFVSEFETKATLCVTKETQANAYIIVYQQQRMTVVQRV
jgi:hypothetical protein